MYIIFDPKPPFIRMCEINDESFSIENCGSENEWGAKILNRLKNDHKIEVIGHILYHGGEVFNDPVTYINEDSLSKMEKCIPFLPEHNDLTYKILTYCQSNFPGIPQLLISDTAFFNHLPPEASTYAVPYKLRAKGIKRYGGYGIGHQWAYELIKPNLKSDDQRILSIYLGNHPNIAAIKNGICCETSVGFSTVEGIPSKYGCGDLDPSCVFTLHADGVDFEEINQLLSKKSGFTGLAGRDVDFFKVINNHNEKELNSIKSMLQYHILRYIGSFLSVMGGIDAIVFISSNLPKTLHFIEAICHRLQFIGLKIKDVSDVKNNILSMSEKDSKIKCFSLEYNNWMAISELMENYLKGDKNERSKTVFS